MRYGEREREVLRCFDFAPGLTLLAYLTVYPARTILGGEVTVLNVGEQVQTDLLKWRVAAVFWMAIIFVLSSALFAPRLSFDATLDFLGVANYAARKCAHAGEFGFLMLLWFRSLYPNPFSLGRARVWAVSVSLVYAASDEFHQSFVPLRSGKVTDVLFDAAGILIVAYLIGRIDRSASKELYSKLLGRRPESDGR